MFSVFRNDLFCFACSERVPQKKSPSGLNRTRTGRPRYHLVLRMTYGIHLFGHEKHVRSRITAGARLLLREKLGSVFAEPHSCASHQPAAFCWCVEQLLFSVTACFLYYTERFCFCQVKCRGIMCLINGTEFFQPSAQKRIHLCRNARKNCRAVQALDVEAGILRQICDDYFSIACSR